MTDFVSNTGAEEAELIEKLILSSGQREEVRRIVLPPPEDFIFWLVNRTPNPRVGNSDFSLVVPVFFISSAICPCFS